MRTHFSVTDSFSFNFPLTPVSVVGLPHLFFLPFSHQCELKDYVSALPDLIDYIKIPLHIFKLISLKGKVSERNGETGREGEKE